MAELSSEAGRRRSAVGCQGLARDGEQDQQPSPLSCPAVAAAAGWALCGSEGIGDRLW